MPKPTGDLRAGRRPHRPVPPGERAHTTLPTQADRLQALIR